MSRRAREREGRRLAKADPTLYRANGLCTPCPFVADCKEYGRWCDDEGIPITNETDEV